MANETRSRARTGRGRDRTPDRGPQRCAQGQGLQRVRPHPRRTRRDRYRSQGLQGRHHLGGGAMMARAHPTFALRPYLPQDAAVLADIFRASVEELTDDDYTPPQQEAWAAFADDMDEFAARLAKHLTLVATMEGSPVGFISLDAPTEIGLFYVHPAVAHRGVGKLLYDAVEKLSRSRGTPHLSVDASDTAREF